MASFVKALLASLVCHALLAAGLALWLDNAQVTEIAQLDLSSVELSFSDDVHQSAPPSVMPPSSTQESAPEPVDGPPTEERVDEHVAPPALEDGVPLPEPGDEPPEEMVPPDVASMPTPVVPAPDQARIDAPAKPSKPIKAKYPSGSRRRGEEGDVLIEIFVGLRGVVESAVVVKSSGYVELDSEALKAALKASFTPARSAGGPVESKMRLPFSFRLTGK